MSYNYDYERPFPIDDEKPITPEQHRYIGILAEWLKYRERVVCIKIGEVLGKQVHNIWELRCKEASKVIDAWKRLKKQIEED